MVHLRFHRFFCVRIDRERDLLPNILLMVGQSSVNISFVLRTRNIIVKKPRTCNSLSGDETLRFSFLSPLSIWIKSLRKNFLP